MDKIINSQGFLHIIEKIFLILKQEDLLSCQLINKSSNQILDDPNFWLRKWINRGLSGKNLTDWRNAIQLSKNTKLESKITRYLRRILKRSIFIDVPCYIDKKVVERYLNNGFVIPRPYQFIDMILEGEMETIQLAVILMKNPSALLFWVISHGHDKLNIINILAPCASSTYICDLIDELRINEWMDYGIIINALAPFNKN